MNEQVLQKLLSLFVTTGTLVDRVDASRRAAESLVQQQMSRTAAEVFLQKNWGSSLASDLRAELLQSTARELSIRQKYTVFLQLCELVLLDRDAKPAEEDWLDQIQDAFRLGKKERLRCRHFARRDPLKSLGEQEEPNILLLQEHEVTNPLIQSGVHEGLGGRLWVLYIAGTRLLYLRYEGLENLSAGGSPLPENTIVALSQGTVIRGGRMKPLYFSDLRRRFLVGEAENRIQYLADEVRFLFPGGKTGLHPFRFEVTGGNLVGVMGGSGAGKSTLLSILNGTAEPAEGAIRINGLDLYADARKVQGLIGNIPQDDLLIEELTVYQNLYYNTKLCFGQLDSSEIDRKVSDMLQALGLSETRDLKVGNALNKTISGGQRKRLNIALELIREPSILFVDEPTSGLSSRDAENVMDLLKQLALNGKLVFVVIHQPSSEIFKLFDRLLLLDRGGYPVYDGNPVESVAWFRRLSGQADADDSECATCGHLNPEEIFNILEAPVLDDAGFATQQRKVQPEEWYAPYRQQVEARPKAESRRILFPPPPWRKAGFFGQWLVFFLRDIKSKLANTSYLAITLLEAPILALVLGFILRYAPADTDYSMSANPNVPAYLFICVIVALFLGLSVSAEEILRDRKIRRRESFLHLSPLAYLLSKIFILFLISAIQTSTFILVGNLILDIQGMGMTYFGILFAVSCFSNLLGLNISSAFDSAVTVYILIPFLIIPQILLSGVIVRFDKLNPVIGAATSVPVIGDIMASRWAFEALAVAQFRENDFEQPLFASDAAMSRATYRKDWWMPVVRERIDRSERLLKAGKRDKEATQSWQLVREELGPEATRYRLATATFLQGNAGEANMAAIEAARNLLKQLKDVYIRQYNNAEQARERAHAAQVKRFGSDESLEVVRRKGSNESLSDLVRGATVKERVEVVNNRIYQRYEPVFQDPGNKRFFSSPFFIADKPVGSGTSMSTYASNLLVIWSMCLLLFVTLYTDLLRRLLQFFARVSKR
ncbi:MAG: ATP-binding cassette domain-containing protein [Bacteroidota bacterium]|jgi:ABC-type multidrug transport system ATPase subunit|nr:ATP-binding cassette domain-containing protein [Bacteroidia bacterium]HRU60201.1 ATP-binding cassette domain-containing protein [Bacteroidia bacterium]